MKPASWIVRVTIDVRLSFAARYLLCWFGCQPRGWRYSVDHARTAMGVGRQKYQATLAELKKAGFVSTAYQRDGKTGQITRTHLILHDPPRREGGDRPTAPP